MYSRFKTQNVNETTALDDIPKDPFRATRFFGLFVLILSRFSPPVSFSVPKQAYDLFLLQGQPPKLPPHLGLRRILDHWTAQASASRDSFLRDKL